MKNGEDHISEYRWCDGRGQWVSMLVCDNNVGLGRCRRNRKGCRVVRSLDLSEAERVRRAAIMREVRRNGVAHAKGI